MKRILLCVLCWAGTLFNVLSDPAIGRLPNGIAYIKEELYVCLKAQAAAALAQANAPRLQVDTAGLANLHPAILSVKGGNVYATKWLAREAPPAALMSLQAEIPVVARTLKAVLRPGEDAAVVADALRGHPDIEWVDFNRVHDLSYVPNDMSWSLQWGPARINATNAWDIPQATTALRVAIVDTGVDLTHVDLASRIVYQQGFGENLTGDARRDGRGGTSIDHGTHVAGIAAAIRDNDLGIAGVANAGIMAMGCSVWSQDKNEYRIGYAAEAILAAIAIGATVINCSFGYDLPNSVAISTSLDLAQQLGVVVVCAAGNDGMPVSASPSAGWGFHPWPILVSNIQTNDAPNPSSNYGNEIGLAAPGTDIYSTVTTNNIQYPSDNAGDYNYMSGTSMAAPHVAGAVALVRSMNPNRIGGTGAKYFLYRTAQDLGTPGKDPIYGYGMLQLPASFLGVLKRANTFAGYMPVPALAQGTFEMPYASIPAALASTPAGGTVVLNGGLSLSGTYAYPAQAIKTHVTLTAFPDRPVTIGR